MNIKKPSVSLLVPAFVFGIAACAQPEEEPGPTRLDRWADQGFVGDRAALGHRRGARGVHHHGGVPDRQARAAELDGVDIDRRGAIQEGLPPAHARRRAIAVEDRPR